MIKYIVVDRKSKHIVAVTFEHFLHTFDRELAKKNVPASKSGPAKTGPAGPRATPKLNYCSNYSVVKH